MFSRSVGHFIAPVLTALLMLTTPVGTGQGVHADQLLHPILPHLHLISGHFEMDEELAAVSSETLPSRPVNGPALGSGNGAIAAGLGLAIGPTLPLIEFAPLADPRTRLADSESTSPTEFRDAPSDPPPDQLV